MTEPQPHPTAPLLLTGTQPNPPAAQRPSTWTGIATLLGQWSALVTVAAGFLNRDWRLFLAAAVLKTLSDNVGVIQTWYVRTAVTNTDAKLETVAVRTEQELLKQPLTSELTALVVSPEDLLKAAESLRKPVDPELRLPPGMDLPSIEWKPPGGPQ